MANTMDPVPNILGIDKVNMDGKLLLIEEQHASNANFLLNSVLFNALKKSYKICFILFHNTLSHYHNVGIKSGYNLTLLKEKGRIVIIEPMKKIASGIRYIHRVGTTNFEDEIFFIIKEECYKMIKGNDPVIIILDELNHLYNLGFDLRKSLYHIRWLRSLIEYHAASQLCLMIHTYKINLQDGSMNTFAHGLKHMAHLLVKVEPFETGHSSNASGKITITWKIDSIRAKYNWPEVARYVYKLSDRQVQIYAPGTAALLT